MESPPGPSKEKEASFKKKHEDWKKGRRQEAIGMAVWSGAAGAQIALAAANEGTPSAIFMAAAAGSAFVAFTKYLSLRAEESGTDQETKDED